MAVCRWRYALALSVVLVVCSTPAVANQWEHVTFRATRPTTYTYEPAADGLVLRADSHAAASGLVIVLPEELEPVAVSWRWRLEQCFDNDDEHQRAGDDFGARVFILFGRERSWTPWGWLRRRVFTGPFDRVRPRRVLSYVWASRAAPGHAAFSPISRDVYQVVARSGCPDGPGWTAERYELAGDFARAFPEPRPRVVALGVMTDTDDTAAQAIAWYGDLLLHLPGGETRLVPFEAVRADP